MSKNESHNKKSRRTTTIRRSIAALLAVTFAAATALTTASFSRVGGASLRESGPTPPVALPAPQGDELLIELSTNGFAPAEVTRPAGAFAISVDNRDVAGEYVLHLKGEGGVLLKEVRVQKGSAGWTVDLPAGTYTLMVANHPDWVCQITLQ